MSLTPGVATARADFSWPGPIHLSAKHGKIAPPIQSKMNWRSNRTGIEFVKGNTALYYVALKLFQQIVPESAASCAVAVAGDDDAALRLGADAQGLG